MYDVPVSVNYIVANRTLLLVGFQRHKPNNGTCLWNVCVSLIWWRAGLGQWPAGADQLVQCWTKVSS